MLLALITQRLKQQQDDLTLLKRIERKDQQALSELYDRYASLLYTLSRRILPSPEEAEDVVQEVFLLVWKKSSTYVESRGTVYSWIITMCRNKAIDTLRSKRFKKQQQEIDIEEAKEILSDDHRLNPQEQAVVADYQRIVQTALKRLSRDQIRILELSYFKGYSQSEIARILKMPLGTVKTKMRQGVLKLRQLVRGEQKG
ncbi:MAG TPA: sigma-70 family RNA polymerase sigma factor [Bacteroidota bacterium]|nr:sigma-70 family RNA polymerase sigma factor [Bacteroidota bacterium]